MSIDSTDATLIGFEENNAARVLLAKIGIESDFGYFVASHLQDVLRNQHADLRLESVSLLSIGKCTAGGQRGQEEYAIEITSLMIPFELEAVVTVQDKRYQLELGLTLRAQLAVDKYEVESDLVIRKQSRVQF